LQEDNIAETQILYWALEIYFKRIVFFTEHKPASSTDSPCKLELGEVIVEDECEDVSSKGLITIKNYK